MRAASFSQRRKTRAFVTRGFELVVLYAEAEPAKFERAATRWFSRYLDEGKDVSLLKAHQALAALSELRSGEGAAAAKLLIELTRGNSCE